MLSLPVSLTFDPYRRCLGRNDLPGWGLIAVVAICLELVIQLSHPLMHLRKQSWALWICNHIQVLNIDCLLRAHLVFQLWRSALERVIWIQILGQLSCCVRVTVVIVRAFSLKLVWVEAIMVLLTIAPILKYINRAICERASGWQGSSWKLPTPPSKVFEFLLLFCMRPLWDPPRLEVWSLWHILNHGWLVDDLGWCGLDWVDCILSLDGDFLSIIYIVVVMGLHPLQFLLLLLFSLHLLFKVMQIVARINIVVVMRLHTCEFRSLIVLNDWFCLRMLQSRPIGLAQRRFPENWIGLECLWHCVWIVVVGSFRWVDIGLGDIQLRNSHLWAHLGNMHLWLLVLTDCIERTRPDLDCRLSPVWFLLFWLLWKTDCDLC